MSKEIVITIRERPPCHFESFEELKRYADSLPTSKQAAAWPVGRLAKKRPASRPSHGGNKP